MLHRWAYPSQNLPPPLPEDADLGLVEPLSSVSISEDSSLSEFVGTNTDEVTSVPFAQFEQKVIRVIIFRFIT